MALENPNIESLGIYGSKGAMILLEDGTYKPNFKANKT